MIWSLEAAKILGIKLTFHETTIKLFKLPHVHFRRNCLAESRLLLRVVQRTCDGCFVFKVFILIMLRLVLGIFDRTNAVFDCSKPLRSLFPHFFEADVRL